MKEFELNDPSVQVKGGVIHAFLDAFGAYRTRGEKVVKRVLGTSEISADSLYCASELLGSFRELQDQFGPGFMRRIGQSVYERVEFPPGLETFEDALAIVDTAYHMNHVNSGDNIGHYQFTQDGNSQATVVCDNPYPCAFDEGIFSGIAKQFGKEVKITHSETDGCRHNNGERCVYQITW